MSEHRYSRQQILAGIGPDGQEKCRNAHVLIVGAGGLGAPVLLYLAGAGVGKITIIDHDTVSLSNLHRQILFSVADLGASKAACAARRMLSLNPDIEVIARTEKLHPGNIAAVVEDVNVVVDAADSLPLTYQLSSACMAAAIPLISASALEQHGYVGGFCGGAPSYRAVFPDMPNQIGSCAVNGVLGPVVGVLGSLQAQWVLQVILGQQPSPLGQIFRIDLATMRTGLFRFDDVPEPDVPDIPFILPEMIQPDDWVVELRPASEAPTAIIPEAHRILLEQIAGADLPEDGRIVLCCRSGVRAHRAARVLQGQGWHHLALVAAE